MKYFIALMLAIMLATTATLADEVTDVALDKHGQTLGTKDGRCVLTKWQSDQDKCKPHAVPAPKEEAKPAPLPNIPEFALENRTLYFDFDQEALTIEDLAKLDSLSGAIGRDKGVTKGTVVGHTDIIGDEAYNLDLSKRRARNAQFYLLQKVKIPMEVVTTRGVGFRDAPPADCPKNWGERSKKRIDCLSQQRRVVIELTYQK